MTQNQPVDVISVCSADGTIKPLRLRIANEGQQFQRIDVDQVVSTMEIQHVGVESTVFLCRGRVGDRTCLFELKYDLRTHSWCLMRKIY